MQSFLCSQVLRLNHHMVSRRTTSFVNFVRSKCGNTISQHGYCTTASLAQQTVPIVYVEADGTEREVQAEIGKNLLDIAHENNVELEGACGGELACSTCHLIFEPSIHSTLTEMTDEEEDMLDLAFEVTDTSRLGCQILVREDFAGMKVQIPDDGF